MRRIDGIAELMSEAPERPWWGNGDGFYSGRPFGATYGKDPLFRPDPWPKAGVSNVIMQGPDHLDWAIARIRRLEEALKAAKREHEVSDDPFESCPAAPGRLPPGAYTCACGADVHNAAIDAVLKEDL